MNIKQTYDLIVDFLTSYFSKDAMKKAQKLQLSLQQKEEELTLLQSSLKASKKKDNAQITDLKIQIEELHKKINTITLSQQSGLEQYCDKHFKKIPMIAYKQKRDIKGKYYSIALNELISPDSYAVYEHKKGLDLTGDVMSRARIIGDKTAKVLTWTDDKNLDKSGDYYLYPNEALALKKCDCEDHSYVNASCDPEIGMAWGFYKTTGHCYNLFVRNNQLYILDTVGNTANVLLWKGNRHTDYKIHYIITKKFAYEVDGSVIFGDIAGW